MKDKTKNNIIFKQSMKDYGSPRLTKDFFDKKHYMTSRLLIKLNQINP